MKSKQQLLIVNNNLLKMTEKAILKDKTTAHVRALLMSAPVPLTVNELKRDYFTFIGEQLRFRDMGYTTLEDFLRYSNVVNPQTDT